MKPSEVKQEYRLQEWSSMIQEQKASGLSIKRWCEQRNISEHSYYYRLRQLREAACTLLEDSTQPTQQMAELPLCPSKEAGMLLRLTSAGGATLEISNANSAALERILQVLIHADQCNGI